MRAVDVPKSEREGSELPGGGGEGGTPSMGEKMAHEQELREQLKEHGATDHAPYESAETKREDKERNQEVHEQNERAQEAKQPGQKAASKQAPQQQPRGAQAQAGGTAKQQGTAPQTKQMAAMRGSDGFEGLQRPAASGPSTVAAKAKIAAPPPLLPERPSAAMKPLTRPGPQDAIGALNNAQDPGFYFVEQQNDGNRGDEQDDPEMEAAVEECIRLLFGVRGIHRIGPGTNDANEAVIVISVSRGFTESSMKLIPETVHRFKTLVALPYELLPLRREIF